MTTTARQAHFATYCQQEEVYTLDDLARIAEVIWRGQRRQGFNRQGTQKWCDASTIGVTMRKAHFVSTVTEWQDIKGYT